MPTRPTKSSSGSQDFSDGTTLTASELNADFQALYNGFSAITDSAIDAAANIDPSKIGDYSASATEQKASSTPGSGGSPTLATTMEGELEQLRYTIERLSLGITGTTHSVRYTGSANVDLGWIEYPHRFGSLVTNGRFAVKTTGATSAPEGWALVGTPTNCALATAVAAEGAGKVLNMTANAANEGIAQTFAGLKASTRYLAVARARANSGTARMTITGADAASQYRGVTVDTTSASFTTLSAVIQTDSTPASIVLGILAAGNGDDVDFSRVALYECSVDALYPVDSVAVRTTITASTSVAGSGVLSSAYLDTAVVPPGPGYMIRVKTKIDLVNTSSGSARNYVFFLYENGTEVDAFRIGISDGLYACAAPSYLNTAPVPGTTYTYTVKGYGLNSSAATANSTASAAAETPRTYLDLELVKL